MSEEDFYRLAGEDSDWEYLDGRIVVHSPASNRHEDLFRFLFLLLGSWLDRRGGGVLRGSRYPMRLDPLWSPEPDLMVVREERKALLGEHRLEGPADLVVEIVSKSDSHRIYKEKLPRYREAGIPEIWIVDPLRCEILADRLVAGVRESRAAAAGRIASTAVPAFWFDAAWLWEAGLPQVGECLARIMPHWEANPQG